MSSAETRLSSRSKDLPFPIEEYQERLGKVRAAMDRAGVDVLVVADPSNMAWLTGYDGWSFYTPQAVVVGLDGQPLWWGRELDVNGALHTVYMDESSVHGYPEDLVQAAPQHPYRHLAEILAEAGHASDRIGVEMDNYYYTAAAHDHLTGGLGDASFTDATGLVNWQRAVKSPRELDYMRRAGRITERIVDRILEMAEPGVRANDIAAEILRTGIAGTEEHGGDYPAIVPLVGTGSTAGAPHLTWDDRPLEPGSATFFEVSGCVRRYHAPLSRSLFLGTPPRQMVDAADALIDGLEIGLDAARAGNRACDVADALFGALRRAGIERGGRCGYPIGLSYPPDWGERTISFRSGDNTVLEPNMTFHFMPAIWTDDWGLEITESIVIREDGPAETLSHCPRRLLVKE